MKKAFEVKNRAVEDAAELILAEIKAIGADEGETWVSHNILTELYYELGKGQYQAAKRQTKRRGYPEQF